MLLAISSSLLHSFLPLLAWRNRGRDFDDVVGMFRFDLGLAGASGAGHFPPFDRLNVDIEVFLERITDNFSGIGLSQKSRTPHPQRFIHLETKPRKALWGYWGFRSPNCFTIRAHCLLLQLPNGLGSDRELRWFALNNRRKIFALDGSSPSSRFFFFRWKLKNVRMKS